jgi:hypothetical protein
MLPNNQALRAMTLFDGLLFLSSPVRGSFALWPAVLLCAPTLVWAEAAPPEGSKPLTEILRPIEAQPDFAYFEEIELEDGKYKIEYFKKDRSKQKIEVDPLTGAPSKPAAGR